MSKFNQDLPAEVEASLTAYIERIKAINWFKPSAELKRETVDTQVHVALKAFGVEASIEYRRLKTEADWNAARDAALDAAWDATRDATLGAAWGASRDATLGATLGAAWNATLGATLDATLGATLGASRDAAWNASRGAAWNAAWGAAWGAVWGACDILALNLDTYKEKYPTGNFIHLIPLWEAGLYPCGVVDEKFVIYVPASEEVYPTDLIN